MIMIRFGSLKDNLSLPYKLRPHGSKFRKTHIGEYIESRGALGEIGSGNL